VKASTYKLPCSMHWDVSMLLVRQCKVCKWWNCVSQWKLTLFPCWKWRYGYSLCIRVTPNGAFSIQLQYLRCLAFMVPEKDWKSQTRVAWAIIACSIFRNAYCKSLAPVELWDMFNAWLKQLKVVQDNAILWNAYHHNRMWLPL